MSTINRRQFISRAAMTAGSGAWFAVNRGASAEDATYRACIIGDTKQGGYGHSVHLVWGLRDDVEVVALADPDEQGRAKRAAEAGAARTYADYREMLEREKPDLVAVGPRWTNNHLDYLLACSEIGAHGFMEKPLTPDLEAGDKALAALEQRNLKWAIAFNFRAAPQLAHAKRLIFEEKIIGDVLEVRARGKEDHRAGGEDLIVLGIHLFDLMRYFMGMPQWCFSDILVDGRPATRDDVHEATESLGPIVGDDIQAVFGFGAVKGFFASKKNENKNSGRYGLDIYGSNGIVSIRVDSIPRIYYVLEPSWSPGLSGKAWKVLPDMPQSQERAPAQVSHYAPIIDDLINAVEEDREPAVSMRHGLEATEMIQSIFEAPLHQGPVPLPLQTRSHPLLRW